MKTKPNPFLSSSIHSLAVVVLCATGLLSSYSAEGQATGFNKTAAGPWDYDDTANWVGGNINGIWDSSLSLAAAQSVTFDSNLTLAAGLSFGYTGNQPLTLRGDGTDRTITLGGDITVSPVSNQTVTIGSTTVGQKLNVNLGGNRTFSVASGRTLRIHNALSGGNLTLNGNNSSTAVGGAVILSGDSAAAASSGLSVTRGATLSFDSTASGSAGATRAQSLQLAGGALSITGNAVASSVETITGALTIAPGQSYNSVTLTPGTGTHLQLNAGSLVRSGTGAVLFRGTGLGVNAISSPTANSSNIAFVTAPTAQLVGGTLGGKTAAILPWAIVDTSATGLGSSFATYDATNGVRALGASEFSTTIATDGSTDGHNIKLTSTGTALTVTGATSVNSLFIDHNTQAAGVALTGTGSLTVTSGAVFVNIASMPGTNGATVDIAKNLNFGSTQGVIGTSSSTNQRRVGFSGGISGSGGVVFYDTGVNTNQATGFYLNNANTYTGDTHINGTVSVAVNNALPNFTNSSRTGDVYLNGVLKLITTNGTVQINGLSGNGTVFSQYSNSNKTLAVGDNNATSTFDGRIIVDGGTGSINLRKVGTGTLTLTGTDSTYTGTTAVQNGILSAVTLNNIGTPLATSSLGRPTSVLNGTIALGNSTTTGTLRVTGTGETTDRVINLAGSTGGGGIDQSGTGHLKFASGVTATGNGLKTLTLTGSTAGTGEIAGAIINSSSATSLTKSGTGSWTLSGDNSYTGTTSVNQGKLVINGNSSLATGDVSVAMGATLGGGGILGGATTINGSVAPGNSIGTLTVNNEVTWNANDAWVFELGSAASSLALAGSGTSIQDLLNLTGTGSDFIKGSGSTFTFDFANTGSAGFYKLVDWTGTSGFVAGDFVATNLAGGASGTFIVDAGTSALYLTVVPEPDIAMLTGGFGVLALLRRRRSK